MATKDPVPSSPEAPKNDSSSSKKRKSALDEIEVDLSLPEPPSKKARRALKKGKPLPAKPTSDDEEDDDKTADGAQKDGAKDGKKKKERSPHGVWIGNLRFTVTRNELRKWLVDNSGGSITDDLITRVHMPMTKPVAGGPGPKKAPENRGFAYVDFSTFEANVAAIALSETEWHNRKLLIKDSKSFEGRPKKEQSDAAAATTDGAKAASSETQAAAGGSTKIFVGNLSFNTTEDDLHAHFEKCGKIRWIKVATFEDSGKCKGYGWVNFEDAEAAAWAVKGFVKVRETVETLEDFMDEDPAANGDADTTTKEEDDDVKPKKEADGDSDSDSDSGSDSDSDADTKPTTADTNPPKPKKQTAAKEPPRIRTRKWWVNQLLGRNLKIELAEDDLTRYNKRFGKGAARHRQQQQQQQDQQQSHGGGGRHNNNNNNNNRRHDANGEHDAGGRSKPERKKPEVDINVARLTGAVVAPQGKKVTFD